MSYLAEDNTDNMSNEGKRQQPEWQPPTGGINTGLRVFNSLTRKKEPFVSQNGKRVLWYSCGPTVYDSAHMGHARSYISFDILRRVFRDYFKYDVIYAMNITDIDDKIIKRARQNYLLKQYIETDLPLHQILQDTTQALEPFAVKFNEETDADKKAMYANTLGKVKVIVGAVEAALKEKQNQDRQDEAKRALLDAAKDLLCDWLDHHNGASVTENSIFEDLPRHFEEEFHQDMEALNVLPADVLTRVSEYVPEVIEFLKTIITNGFAYESNKSVYFDTMKFAQSKGHFYAKLVPEAFGDNKAMLEGEGDLSVSEEQLSEKRSQNDFALWKASKPGEPSWPSPWGMGRPGWHIECSVMASSILGKSLDIHTGGSDLKFPHHDNELAQSEAHFGNDNWVRYFLHSGHLNISGCKMSKSLKNFITIREALNKHSAQQLRFAFLLHSWKDTLDYSDQTMKAALNYEKLANEFFLTVKDILRKSPSSGAAIFLKWQGEELKLDEKWANSKIAVHNALCDSVDTRTCMDAIRELITNCNIYIDQKIKSSETPNALLLENIAKYITEIFTMFGAVKSDVQIGFQSAGAEKSVNREEAVMPVLDATARFRDDIRQVARNHKDHDILELCDKFRDDVLPNLGVRLEDREGGASVIKLVDRDALLKEREEKLEQEKLRLEELERKKEGAAAAQAARDAQRRIPPTVMFKTDPPQYSQFDDKGLPTHDMEGKELAKAQIKKLKKLYDAQEKKYNDFLKSQGGTNNSDVSA